MRKVLININKTFSIFLVIVICLSISSCSIFKVNITSKESSRESQSFSADEAAGVSQTPPISNTESMQNEYGTKDAVTEAAYQNEKRKYVNYITQNHYSYLEYQGEKSNFEPILTYVDLDNDSVDELVYFIEFYSEDNFAYSFGYVYMFDIINGEVVEIFGSDMVGKSRMTDSVRVYKDTDGKYYIAREWRDGRYDQQGALYSYDGEKLSVVYSIYGSYNEPSFYTVSYNGQDVFNGDTGDFINITEEEFVTNQNNLSKKGETVFDSTVCFAE